MLIDFQPSNILVTPDDRIVLLDFGIVKDLDQIEQWGDQSASGTAAYMAPEQARPGMATPAADWYCVGVMLYQCMTGLLPFSGRPGAVLALKERRDPIPPSQLVSGVSPDLERLCLDLMRREPSARPSGEEVLQRLKAELSPADLGPSQRNVFVGRAEELKQLIRAFEDSQSSGGLSAVVIGDSGVGKSFLIRRFVRELRAMRPELVLLAGRCYERESVPYKAVDGIIDQLSQYLQHLPEERAQALLPAQVSLLATLFPVLEPLGALAPQAVASTADALELRSRAFLLLRELLTRLGQDVPLVLLIDDLQWADNDSFALLAEILRPPAPRLLLLATSRKPLSSDAKISSASLVGEVRTIHLEPMTSEESQELAARLLGRRAAREMAAAIAREAGGHPLFIDELVRHQRDAGREGKADLAVRIDQALWQRVTRLQDGPRQLVELLAIAGKPITQALAAQASALGPYALDDAAASLRTSHLARTSGVRLHDTIEPFHDLVREAILANLTADKRRSWHGRLATALETVEVPDAEHLFLHWRGAGQNERAGTYAIKAADQAAASLAFEHASKLYQQALDLLPKLPPEERRALHRKLGQALANAGRGEPAARAYLKATEQATATEQRDLTCKAAEQLMRSGHLDEGTQYLRQVLKSVGLSYPATPLRALFALLLRRIQLTLRGLGYQERSAASISVDVRGQLDVCWAAACGLAMADIIRGAVFQAHYLILALRAGDPLCISRGLAQEAAFRAGAGLPGWKQTEKVLHAAESLGRKIQDQYSLSSVHMSRGLAYHLSGRFRESDEQLLKGEALLREQFICNGWEMDNCKLFLCFNDIYLGEFRRMSERLPRFIEEAEARGDLFSLTNYAVCPLPMSLLVQDQPDRAEQVATDSLTKWSHDGFHLEHYNAMQVQTQIDLYRQQGVAAHKRVLALLPKAKAALLLEVQNPRIEIQDLIGCSAVAAAIEQPAQADKYLKAAERAARRLSREKAAWALALALRIRACIAAVRKEREQARALFEQAAAALAAVDMAMYAAAARLRWGELEGGAAGAQRIAQAEQSMREQGILSPSRFTAFLAPAL